MSIATILSKLKTTLYLPDNQQKHFSKIMKFPYNQNLPKNTKTKPI